MENKPSTDVVSYYERKHNNGSFREYNENHPIVIFPDGWPVKMPVAGSCQGIQPGTATFTTAGEGYMLAIP